MQGNFDHASMRNMEVLGGLRLNDAEVKALSGDIDLSIDDPRVQILDPDGEGRTVTLPDPADLAGDQDDGSGMIFIIINTADADEDLTVNDHEDSQVGSAVPQDGMGIFIAAAGSWYGQGMS